MRSDVLDEAYERLLGKGPEFGGDEDGNHGLTNHGPMAVEVMVRRGLDVDVHRWLDRYLGRLADLPGTTRRITDADWREALGDGRRVGDWTAYFSEQIARRPWPDVLVEWWPRLLPGIVAGSTHGVIRVGHAVRSLLATSTVSGSPGASNAATADTGSSNAEAELARGLAFWAARSRVLPGVPASGWSGSHAPGSAGTGPVTGRPGGARGGNTQANRDTQPGGAQSRSTGSAGEALAAVPRLADQTGLIAHRLTRLADLTGWPDALAVLCPPADPAEVPDALADLSGAAVRHYVTHGQGSPVLLVHTATAPNAVRHVLPVLPQHLWAPSFAAAWAASAAITAAYSPADPVRPAPIPVPDGPDAADVVLDQAARHGDEHVIKFADTVVDLYDRIGDPDLLVAALHAARLIRAPSWIPRPSGWGGKEVPAEQGGRASRRQGDSASAATIRHPFTWKLIRCET